MGRIEKICSYIDGCNSFADIGCDHGLCAEYALKSGKCKSVIISDVSKKSLAKAESLLSGYISRGVCVSVCCDGLRDIPENVSQVLIAGMGGMEIIKILTRAFIPLSFIFQPMKNAAALRKFLLERGAKITVDDVFKDDKFYFILKGERSGGTFDYSESELEFGRDSVKNPVFKEYAFTEMQKLKGYLRREISSADREKIEQRLKLFEKVLKYDC